MKILSLCIVFIIAGCSGTVYTIQNPKPDDDGRIKGILVYGYKVIPKKILLDRIRNDKTGEITHSAYKSKGTKEYCDPDYKIENVTVADYSKPYAIQYDSAFFEISKFSVSLDKGMLASVNSESTPGPLAAVQSLQALSTVREDILNGVESASSQTTQSILANMDGSSPAETPIRCSYSE